MGAEKQPIQLHLAESIGDLNKQVKGDSIRDARIVHRLPATAQKMYNELLQSLNDQEKAFIIAKRYLKVMDHVFKYSSDKNFVEIRYGTEYRKVKAMLNDLEVDLKFRYEELARAKEKEWKLKLQDVLEGSPSTGQLSNRDRPSTGHQSGIGLLSTITHIQFEKPSGELVQRGKIFSKMDISPVDLYDAMLKKHNMLIVDTRSAADYSESHIITEDGRVINIPENIIVPGLSANTLGQRLPKETQIIWNRRDGFDVIVLLDWDTDSFNFAGSKLERLRLCIVEWDLNRIYLQQPVFLSGGFKEFLEYYPTEVTNPHVFLSQTNSEIDEILTIDEVSYPETGSGNMNLKIHAISSFADVQAPIDRDFGDLELMSGPPARASRSEDQLPKDFYSSQKGVSPYRSLSQEPLPKDYFGVDIMVDTLPSLIIEPGLSKVENFEAEPSEVEPIPGPSGAEPVLGPSRTEHSPAPFYNKDEDSSTEELVDERTAEVKIPDEREAQIKSAIEDEKAELLSQVRALKPKSSRDDSKMVVNRNVIEENEELFARPPIVDRSFKPTIVSEVPKEGYTGIRNIRNNCYVSCMMQCLKVLPFVKSMFVFSDLYIRYIHQHPPVVAVHFASVMKSIWQGTYNRPGSFYPQLFLDKIYRLNPIYAKGNHEDTFEFFIVLFNNLSEDCSKELPRPKIMTERERSWYSQLQGRTSFLVDMCYYQLRNTKVCLYCQKPKYIYDSDNTVMLSLSENKQNNYLQYLLKEYLNENLVTDYSCADCKQSATIVNTKEIVLDPEVLIIVLKRYAATKDGTIRKIDAEISFPTDRLEFGGSYYKLYSIPQHSGSMVMGHYYASVLLNDATNTWVLFNDDKITKYSVPITEVRGIKSSCVGFFYVRTGLKKSVNENVINKL